MVDKSKYLAKLFATGGPADSTVVKTVPGIYTGGPGLPHADHRDNYAGSLQASSDSLTYYNKMQAKKEYLSTIDQGSMTYDELHVFDTMLNDSTNVNAQFRLMHNLGTGLGYTAEPVASSDNALIASSNMVVKPTGVDPKPPADKPNTFTAKVGNKYYDPASKGYTNAMKQVELQEAGLYTGKIDGIWGPKTDAAYVKMNQNASMPATKAKVAVVEKEEAAKVSTNTLTNFEVTTNTNQKFYYIASKDKGGKPIQVGEQAYKQLVKRKGWENNSMTAQDFMKMQ